MYIAEPLWEFMLCADKSNPFLQDSVFYAAAQGHMTILVKKINWIALAEYFRDIHNGMLNFINFLGKFAFCLVIYSALVPTYYFSYNSELIIEY